MQVLQLLITDLEHLEWKPVSQTSKAEGAAHTQGKGTLMV
jgi:hypothetical protein